MRRRATAGATVGSPRPTRTTAQPATRHTRVDPAELDGGTQFPFLAQLYIWHLHPHDSPRWRLLVPTPQTPA